MPTEHRYPEFVIPAECDGGDRVPVIRIADTDGNLSDVSAQTVLRLLVQEQSLRDALRIANTAAERERSRVRRLMACLADDLTGMCRPDPSP